LKVSVAVIKSQKRSLISDASEETNEDTRWEQAFRTRLMVAAVEFSEGTLTWHEAEALYKAEREKARDRPMLHRTARSLERCPDPRETAKAAHGESRR
jgi:hypothetical protein